MNRDSKKYKTNNKNNRVLENFYHDRKHLEKPDKSPRHLEEQTKKERKRNDKSLPVKIRHNKNFVEDFSGRHQHNYKRDFDDRKHKITEKPPTKKTDKTKIIPAETGSSNMHRIGQEIKLCYDSVKKVFIDLFLGTESRDSSHCQSGSKCKHDHNRKHRQHWDKKFFEERRSSSYDEKRKQYWDQKLQQEEERKQYHEKVKHLKKRNLQAEETRMQYGERVKKIKETELKKTRNKDLKRSELQTFPNEIFANTNELKHKHRERRDDVEHKSSKRRERRKAKDNDDFDDIKRWRLQTFPNDEIEDWKSNKIKTLFPKNASDLKPKESRKVASHDVDRKDSKRKEIRTFPKDDDIEPKDAKCDEVKTIFRSSFKDVKSKETQQFQNHTVDLKDKKHDEFKTQDPKDFECKEPEETFIRHDVGPKHTAPAEMPIFTNDDFIYWKHNDFSGFKNQEQQAFIMYGTDYKDSRPLSEDFDSNNQKRNEFKQFPNDPNDLKRTQPQTFIKLDENFKHSDHKEQKSNEPKIREPTSEEFREWKRNNYPKPKLFELGNETIKFANYDEYLERKREEDKRLYEFEQSERRKRQAFGNYDLSFDESKCRALLNDELKGPFPEIEIIDSRELKTQGKRMEFPTGSLADSKNTKGKEDNNLNGWKPTETLYRREATDIPKSSTHKETQTEFSDFQYPNYNDNWKRSFLKTFPNEDVHFNPRDWKRMHLQKTFPNNDGIDFWEVHTFPQKRDSRLIQEKGEIKKKSELKAQTIPGTCLAESEEMIERKKKSPRFAEYYSDLDPKNCHSDSLKPYDNFSENDCGCRLFDIVTQTSRFQTPAVYFANEMPGQSIETEKTVEENKKDVIKKNQTPNVDTDKKKDEGKEGEKEEKQEEKKEDKVKEQIKPKDSIIDLVTGKVELTEERSLYIVDYKNHDEMASKEYSLNEETVQVTRIKSSSTTLTLSPTSSTATIPRTEDNSIQCIQLHELEQNTLYEINSHIQLRAVVQQKEMDYQQLKQEKPKAEEERIVDKSRITITVEKGLERGDTIIKSSLKRPATASAKLEQQKFTKDSSAKEPIKKKTLPSMIPCRKAPEPYAERIAHITRGPPPPSRLPAPTTRFGKPRETTHKEVPKSAPSASGTTKKVVEDPKKRPLSTEKKLPERKPIEKKPIEKKEPSKPQNKQQNFRKQSVSFKMTPPVLKKTNPKVA